jgi:anti-anti-sigma regulatory factor
VVTPIAARGLAELALAYTTLHRHSGELTLVAAPPRIKHLLSVTRLDTVFEQCDSVPDLIERTDEFTAAAADSRWASERLPAGV